MKTTIQSVVVMAFLAILGILPASGDRVQQELNDSSTRKTFPVPAAPAGIKIDGQLDEWSATPSLWLHFKPAALAAPGRHTGPEDLSAELGMMWDSEALYLAAQIRDTEPGIIASTGSELWQNDSVEILLDLDLEGDSEVTAMNGDDFQFLLSPLSALSTGKLQDAAFAPQWPEADISMSSAATSNGYCIEARIPLPSKYRQNIRAGTVMGFNAAVNDNDGQGWEAQLRWYPHGHPSSDIRARHRIELVEEAAALSNARFQDSFITVDPLSEGVAPGGRLPICLGISRHIKRANVSVSMVDEYGARHVVADPVPMQGRNIMTVDFPTGPADKAVDWQIHVQAQYDQLVIPAAPCLATQYDRLGRGVPPGQRGPVYGDTSRAILITNLSGANPAEHLSQKRRKQHWQCIPYETGTFSGTMLSAGPGTEAPPVGITLDAEGWYAIQLGLWQHRWAEPAAINLALSGDTAYTGHTIPKPHWKHFDSIQEVFWKYARLGPGEQLLLRHPHGASCSLAFIRLVPLRPREIARLEEERADKSRRRLVAMNDCFSSLFQWGASDTGDIHCHLERFRYSDFGRVCWELGSSGKIYFQSSASSAFGQHLADGDFPRHGEQQLAESLRTLFGKGIDPIRTVVDYAHAIGLECYGSQRIGAWGATPPFEEVFASPFSEEHPEFRCRLKDGTPVDLLSYAFPEVRQQAINIFTAGAERGLDGVNLLYVRGDAFVLYEQPVVDSFVSKYGSDPRQLADNDPLSTQWQHHRAAIMTGFMEELRAALDKTAAEHKRPPVRISAHVPNTPEENLHLGLDIETWVNRGLVDSITVYDNPERKTNLDFFRRICDGKPAEWYLDIGSNRSTEVAPNVARARAAYAAGAAGLCFWDVENLARDFTLWQALRRLGDPDDAASLNANDTWRDHHKLRTLGGYRLEPYSPMSGY